MSLELMLAIALVRGLGRHGIYSIGQINASQPSAKSPDESLKVLDALARLCAPAAPKTALAVSMAITADTCHIWLAANDVAGVPPSISQAVETLWKRLAQYSTDPRSTSSSQREVNAAEQPVHEAVMTVCVSKMRARIERGLDAFRAFVEAMGRTTDDAVCGHARYHTVLDNMKEAVSQLETFVEIATMQTSEPVDDERLQACVGLSRVIAGRLRREDVEEKASHPLQLFGSVYREQILMRQREQEPGIAPPLNVTSNAPSDENLAAFDAARYISKVLSVHRDVHILLKFASKSRGRTVLSKKMEVTTVSGAAQAGPALGCDALASGEGLTEDVVEEMVRKAYENILANDWKGIWSRPEEESAPESGADKSEGKPGDSVVDATIKKAATTICGNLEQLSDPRPQAHAKYILLHHLLQNPAVATTGAVGSSKAACYYCSLYFRKAAPSVQITGCPSPDHTHPWRPPAHLSSTVEAAMVDELLAVVGTVVAEMVGEEKEKIIDSSLPDPDPQEEASLKILLTKLGL